MHLRILDTVHGAIDRRILMNFRVRPEALKGVLPAPFRPKLYGGWAITGICMIRFSQLRPRLVPAAFGVGSENAAHRIAVEWDQDGTKREGVFIPRRNTNSWFNRALGGKVFPGIFEQSAFTTEDQGGQYLVHIVREDGKTEVLFRGHDSDALSPGSVFSDLDEAGRFFLVGATGYSATHTEGHYHGMELHSNNWAISALTIDEVVSHFFHDPAQFPDGSVEIDCALLMRAKEHEWRSRPDLYISPNGASLTTNKV